MAKKYHRKWPAESGRRSWDYRGISEMFEGREVVYYELNDDGKFSRAVEVYSGRNYIIGQESRGSYSRRYSLNNLPMKYRLLVHNLIQVHRNTSWSSAERVNLN